MPLVNYGVGDKLGNYPSIKELPGVADPSSNKCLGEHNISKDCIGDTATVSLGFFYFSQKKDDFTDLFSRIN
jgi:hypothetical protein